MLSTFCLLPHQQFTAHQQILFTHMLIIQVQTNSSNHLYTLWLSSSDLPTHCCPDAVKSPTSLINTSLTLWLTLYLLNYSALCSPDLHGSCMCWDIEYLYLKPLTWFHRLIFNISTVCNKLQQSTQHITLKVCLILYITVGIYILLSMSDSIYTYSRHFHTTV